MHFKWDSVTSEFVQILPCSIIGLGCNFLAHLNRMLRMSFCEYLPSVVRPVSTSLNDFFETPRQISFKLHVEPSVKEGLKIYTNGHGP